MKKTVTFEYNDELLNSTLFQKLKELKKLGFKVIYHKYENAFLAEEENNSNDK